MDRAVVGSWRDVEELLASRPRGTLLRLPRGWVDHPRTYDMRPAVALPAGQDSDWWKRLDERRGLHVTAKGHYYLARLESPRARVKEAGLPQSVPSLQASISLGALLGVVLGRSAPALVVGAALAGAVCALDDRR